MKLTWDNVGERLYETGVKNAVLYPYQTTGEKTGYSKGVAWNGITSISENPSGADETPLYADDIKYLSLRAAEEFGCTLNAYTYPEEFEPCDGSAQLTTGVMIGQQPRQTFGLSYRTTIGNDTELDAHGYKLHLIYGCTASPSSKDYQTINDSPEAIEFSWDVTTNPVAVTGHKPTATLTVDSTKVDAAKMKALEDALYGTADKDAYLPLPDEVITLLAA